MTKLRRPLYESFEDWAIKFASPIILSKFDQLIINSKLELKDLELTSVRFMHEGKGWAINDDTSAVTVFIAALACIKYKIGKRDEPVLVEEISEETTRLQLTNDLWLQIYNLTSLNPKYKPFYVYPASDK